MKHKIAKQLHMDMDSKAFCEAYAEEERELNKRMEQGIFYTIKKDRLIGAVTLGSKVDSYITDCFDNGFYMKGLLADVMANQFLFELHQRVTREALFDCREKRLFPIKQIKIGEDVPLSFQEDIARETEIVTVTDTHMLSPLKSMTFWYKLSDQECAWMALARPCEECKLKDTCEMK